MKETTDATLSGYITSGEPSSVSTITFAIPGLTEIEKIYEQTPIENKINEIIDKLNILIAWHNAEVNR